jgi:hypothetical protein
VPAQHHLGWSSRVLVGGLGDLVPLEQSGATSQRRPALRHGAVSSVSRSLLVLREVRVQLDLVDRRRHTGLGDDAVEVLGQEVRGANRAHGAFVTHTDERLPRLDVLVDGWLRPVDEEQVEPVESESFQRSLHRSQGGVVSVVGARQLGGDEQVVARH